jgi:hypothetical protein
MPEFSVKRNPFVALCEYASSSDWCWKLHCTTCGHSGFRVAFAKIIKGLHPDDENFWPEGKHGARDLYLERDKFDDFVTMNSKISSNRELAEVVAGAKIGNIRKVAKFPEWLGYLGLVIFHCRDRKSKQILSDSLFPQLLDIVDKETSGYKLLKEKQTSGESINIGDLEVIEKEMINSNK